MIAVSNHVGSLETLTSSMSLRNQLISKSEAYSNAYYEIIDSTMNQALKAYTDFQAIAFSQIDPEQTTDSP